MYNFGNVACTEIGSMVCTYKRLKEEFLYMKFKCGPADIYLNPPLHSKEYTRNELNISTKYLVGFIGNMVAIKNVMILTDIFRINQNKLHDVSFLVAMVCYYYQA